MSSSMLSDVRQPQAEINVTPLIDVMLVLLIVFMVGLPLLTRDVPLAIAAEGGPLNAPPLEPLTLRLDALGGLYVQDVPVQPRQLDHLLRSVAAQEPQPAVLIDVADQASYQRMAELMSAAHNARFRHIGFASR